MEEGFGKKLQKSDKGEGKKGTRKVREKKGTRKLRAIVTGTREDMTNQQAVEMGEEKVTVHGSPHQYYYCLTLSRSLTFLLTYSTVACEESYRDARGDELADPRALHA